MNDSQELLITDRVKAHSTKSEPATMGHCMHAPALFPSGFPLKF